MVHLNLHLMFSSKMYHASKDVGSEPLVRYHRNVFQTEPGFLDILEPFVMDTLDYVLSEYLNRPLASFAHQTLCSFLLGHGTKETRLSYLWLPMRDIAMSSLSRGFFFYEIWELPSNFHL
jgi:hypothetical protein